MYMYKRPVTGKDQDKASRMWLVAGRRLNEENRGRKVIGRKMLSRKVISRKVEVRKITIRMTEAVGN
jgi:hypothetical protein